MIPEAKSVGCRLLAIYAKKKRITIPHDCKMNAARASHPSRIKRVVPCRAPLPFAGVPRGFHSWLVLREEGLPSAVAGFDACHTGCGRVSSSLRNNPGQGV